MEPLSSELWVEPQYGTVCEVPPELEYLIGCTHDQIRSKVSKELKLEIVMMMPFSLLFLGAGSRSSTVD